MNAIIEKDVPVVISSLLVEALPTEVQELSREIALVPGVEVHEIHGSSIVISIEASSIDASYKIASSLTAIEGVTGVQLIYANFEDDPVIQERLKR